MKKIALVLMAACLSLIFFPLSSFAVSSGRPGIVNTTTPTPLNPNALMLRLNEIKNTDRSNLSSSEKKALRKELRTMKRSAKSNGHGVYFIIATLIIAILLLILLL